MSHFYISPPGATRWTTRFVGIIWALMTLSALGFVLHFGRNAPWADEWETLPGLLNRTPLLSWLWVQHNEHRLPLPRLIFWILFQITHDFRSGMVLQVLLLSATAIGFLRLARRIRGQSNIADAFFPIVLLHWGHVENFVMGYQICFALTACGVFGLLAIIANTTEGNRVRSGYMAGGVLLLLATTGGSGLAFVPPICAWLLYLGYRERAWGLFVIAAIAMAYIGFYLWGYARPPAHPSPNWSQPERAGVVAAQVLGMSVGTPAMSNWPIAASYVIGVVAVTLFLLIRGAENRSRSLGLLMLLAGAVGLAIAIGIGRSGFASDTMGLWSRYSLLTVPVLAIAYIVCLQAGGKWARCGPMLLVSVAALSLPQNVQFGHGWASSYAQDMDAMEADVRAGLPTNEVIRRNRYLSQLDRDEQIRVGIPLLQNAGISYFRRAVPR